MKNLNPFGVRFCYWWRRRELFVLRPHPFGAAVALLPRWSIDVWEGLIALAHRARCSEVGRVIVPLLAVLSDQPALGTSWLLTVFAIQFFSISYRSTCMFWYRHSGIIEIKRRNNCGRGDNHVTTLCSALWEKPR